jgi:hypothetical protein
MADAEGWMETIREQNGDKSMRLSQWSMIRCRTVRYYRPTVYYVLRITVLRPVSQYGVRYVGMYR